MLRVVSILLVISGKFACHKRRKWGGGPNFSHCLHNELYCSIVDVVPHLCPLTEGNHIFVV